MVNQSHIYTVTENHIEKAQKDTALFLHSNSLIAEMIKDLKSIGNHSLPQGAPFDIESLTKISFHPFLEAATEIDLAVFFIQRGMYKTFYHHLRSFLELYIVAVYFLSPICTKENAREWLNGDRDTPFFSKILKTIFQEPQFVSAQIELQLRDQLQKMYWKLSDIVHNKGELCGHKGVAKANFPRFLEETFRVVLDDFRDCVEIVCVTYSLRYPLILIGFPMIDKFGNNPPLSGFLDEMESAVIRKYISPDTLRFLDAFCEKDDYFTSGRDFVLSRPDMTEEQFKEQLANIDEFEKQFRLGKGWKGSNPSLSSEQMLFQMNAEYNVMKQLRDGKEKVDRIIKDLGEEFEE